MNIQDIATIFIIIFFFAFKVALIGICKGLQNNICTNIVVTFKDGVDEQTKRQIHLKMGAIFICANSQGDHVVMVSRSEVAGKIKAYKKIDAVQLAEPEM